MRIALLLLLAVVMLPGCSTSHPAFGADDMVRVDDQHGVPTYFAFGKLEDWETPEKKVASVLTAACPTGNPTVLTGDVMTFKGVDINRSDMHGKSWMVTFTCDQPVAIPPG
ncbi:MAG: hypothetical protein ABUL54_01910 [Dongia sp.]